MTLRDELKFELLRAARELPPELLPKFFGDLEEVRRTAEMQLRAAATAEPECDKMLTVAEASERLRVSADTLYRKEFPFTRRIGRRRLFSRNGIDAAIRQNDLTFSQTDANLTHPMRQRRPN
jgi:excisionase family DNA binding protein